MQLNQQRCFPQLAGLGIPRKLWLAINFNNKNFLEYNLGSWIIRGLDGLLPHLFLSVSVWLHVCKLQTCFFSPKRGLNHEMDVWITCKIKSRKRDFSPKRELRQSQEWELMRQRKIDSK